MADTSKFQTEQVVEFPKETEIFFREILAKEPVNTDDLEKRKRNFSARYKIPTILNRDLVVISRKFPESEISQHLKNLITKRAVRTISGVTPIAILTQPFSCPGKCIYCPNQAGMPKSYLSSQPAAARALRNKFNPRKQIESRMKALEDSGHPVSKIEIIVMGGTWSALPQNYKDNFIKEIFDSVNGVDHSTLEEAQNYNATKSSRKIIGLTLETRPDYITENELIQMRNYGCTRIEIGVQTIDDEISQKTKRNQTALQVKQASALIKNFGFKFCYHMMPGLPGSSVEKDLEIFREIFDSPDYRPDFLKIYPCQVLEHSELFSWWEKGEYKPYNDKQLIKLILQIKKIVPPFVRIMRLLRDIPVGDICAGAKFSNLRQILHAQPKKIREILGAKDYSEIFGENFTWPCKCIRCREIGFSKLTNTSAQTSSEKNSDKLKLKTIEYNSSNGREFFLSFEDANNTLYALLRLRIPNNDAEKISHKWSDFFSDCAFVREVHSYGQEVAVGKGEGVGQHRGLGKQLLAEAEKISRKNGKKNIAIIAGVGTREYYKKFGYSLQNTYMVKELI